MIIFLRLLYSFRENSGLFFKCVTLVILTILVSVFYSYSLVTSQTIKKPDKEEWWKDPEFDKYQPKVIAVLPMVNMTFDEQTARCLKDEVYKRLQSKGYQKIDVTKVREVMNKLGIQTPEQLSGISYSRLGAELNCDAVIQGQVNQSDTQHKVGYDAVVVSCSLQLIHCNTGRTLWRCEQWRTAHRQWQADPFNMFINLISHEEVDRNTRVAWLVQEMFRTLPSGPIQVVSGDLLSKAIEIEIDITEPLKKLKAKEDKESIEINLSSDILFDFDKSIIRKDAEEVLKNLIPIIQKFNNAEVTIIGHTDSIGTNSYNQNLSLARAKACENWIKERVALTNQIFNIVGKGENVLIFPNDTDENRQKNRRVEIIIQKNEK